MAVPQTRTMRKRRLDVDTGDSVPTKRVKNEYDEESARRTRCAHHVAHHVPGRGDIDSAVAIENSIEPVLPTAGDPIVKEEDTEEEDEGDEEFAASQSMSYGSTPALSTAVSSRGSSHAPGAQTPVVTEDLPSLRSGGKDKFAPGQGLARALQSRHLPEDFLEKFRAAYPGLVDEREPTNEEAQTGNEEVDAESVHRVQPIQVGSRKSKTEAGKPPFACPNACPGLYDEVSTFREHIHTEHEDEYKLCKHDDCVQFVRAGEDNKMLLVWHNRADHGQHALQCTEHPNCNFKPTFNEKSFIAHVQSHKLRCHRCLDEKKRALPFGTQNALMSHMKTMHTEESFPCLGYDFITGQPCDRKFPTEGGRTKHMGCAHKGQFLCPYCPLGEGKVVMHTTERALALHVRSEHKDEYKDDWRTKAGDKSFQCPHCKMMLTKNIYLQKHIASKHAGGVMKHWKCDTTDLSDSLRMVDDEDTPLQWDYQGSGCDAAFANKQSLIDHVRSSHFGLLRWEALKKLRAGQASMLAGAKKARQAQKSKPKQSAAGVLSGVTSDEALV